MKTRPASTWSDGMVERLLESRSRWVRIARRHLAALRAERARSAALEAQARDMVVALDARIGGLEAKVRADVSPRPPAPVPEPRLTLELAPPLWEQRAPRESQ